MSECSFQFSTHERDDFDFVKKNTICGKSIIAFVFCNVRRSGRGRSWTYSSKFCRQVVFRVERGKLNELVKFKAEIQCLLCLYIILTY